jgi:hypothetical protein
MWTCDTDVKHGPSIVQGECAFFGFTCSFGEYEDW